MVYDEGFSTFKVAQNGAILTVTFDYPTRQRSGSYHAG